MTFAELELKLKNNKKNPMTQIKITTRHVLAKPRQNKDRTQKIVPAN